MGEEALQPAGVQPENRYPIMDIEPQLLSDELQACDYLIQLMPYATIIMLDLDGVQLTGGKIPVTAEGHLDMQALQEQSPYTLPILECEVELDLRGIPTPTITGKSFTVFLIADLKRRMLMEKAGQYGMLEAPYVMEPNITGIVYSSEARIKSEFLEPNTKRMRAINEEGQPDQHLLVLNYWATDNGARVREIGTGATVEKNNNFSEQFYRTFLRPDVVDLFRATTRGSKGDRQDNIRSHYYGMPNIDVEDYKNRFDHLSLKELWELSSVTAFDYSYPSPEFGTQDDGLGAKFNLELGLKKILEDAALRGKWIALAESLGYTDFDPILRSSGKISDETAMKHAETFIRSTLQHLFPEDVAAISVNFVNEKDSGMGKRIVIDLNPAGQDKYVGFLEIVAGMDQTYHDANMTPPHFVEKGIKGGDGPHQNDKAAICRELGWTNYDDEHEKVDGYPVYNGLILDAFGIKVKDGEKIAKLEHTLLFLRLILMVKFGKPLDNLPTPLRDKLIIPAQYFSQ